jgi:hypothetical protein
LAKGVDKFLLAFDKSLLANTFGKRFRRISFGFCQHVYSTNRPSLLSSFAPFFLAGILERRNFQKKKRRKKNLKSEKNTFPSPITRGMDFLQTEFEIWGGSGVARFFFIQRTKMGINVPIM